MNSDQIIEKLKTQRTKFSDLKVKSLALFGSMARGDAKPDSDIDFVVEFEGSATFDLDVSWDIITHKVPVLPEKIKRILG